ncbi:MAG: amidohydrolase family protein, partial [Spirochaetales bacterium]|nr:amidohydrolase family protein [Candidatus Physcosoma equi]
MIIRNATILDGTGNAPYRANVAVFGDSIAFITEKDISRGKLVVDAKGKYLAPGFIDMHTHSDLEVLRDPDAKARIGQGITTDVSGNCGIGVFPFVQDALKGFVSDVLGEYPEWAWSDYCSMKRYYEEKGIGCNELFLVSHTAIRVAVMGYDSLRAATDEEIDMMCKLLRSELQADAIGFSSGLYYAPCVFASREELK